jgi:hypothetical protein
VLQASSRRPTLVRARTAPKATTVLRMVLLQGLPERQVSGIIGRFYLQILSCGQVL